ncbi:hypothetical protein FNJ84_00770 [Paracoccus sp. M683]|uniref:hypothetical protein n=1 Tax=Paracoccus sp. M683 TaxID=2594268 RepID=UPI001181004C|nr:hypothetical protein [Paracoccus sp. M683]TRW99247.1 hypothetical protein FNJ84_00770 [Paracoccus sp. M683]
MLDFGGLVYLDVQKTGSTFITGFLRAACRLPERHYHQHGRIRDGYRAEAVHVISVRDPLRQYLSLYRYGLDGRGGLWHRLNRLKVAGLYTDSQAGFQRFLSLMLDADLAESLAEDFPQTARKFDIGFLTHRHLMLALHKPLATLRSIDRDDLASAYRKRRIWTDRLRQEHLTDDLRALVARYPDLLDAEAAETFLSAAPAINRSASGSTLTTDIPPELRDLLHRKEALIHREFYPD